MLRAQAGRLAHKLTGKSSLREAAIHGRRELERRYYAEQYGPDQLRALFERVGVRKGGVVHLQSSWNEFYNFSGKPLELINTLLEALGPEGTLVMPASPLPLRKPVEIFDFRRLPSRNGLVTELFRRYPKTLRSVHRTSSVCALGPAAEYLTKDHHHTETAWDPASPCGRMVELGARQLSLGLYPFWSTALHCVDSILRNELDYHRRLFPSVTTYRWRDLQGREGVHSYYKRIGHVEAWRLKRHFDRDRYVWRRLSNLRVFAIDLDHMVEHSLALARRGITIYTSPRPGRGAFAPV